MADDILIDPLHSSHSQAFSSEHDTSSHHDDIEDQNIENLEESAPNFAFVSFVAESEELLNIFRNIDPTHHLKRIVSIVQKYQEQPQLLDPHLKFMTNVLLEILRTKLSQFDHQNFDLRPDPEAVSSFQLLYILTKVRGHKTVSRLFSHSVEDLERTFLHLEYWLNTKELRQSSQPKLANINLEDILTSSQMGEQHKMAEEAEWRVPYVLLLWLSVICLLPFDLNALDGTSSQIPSSSSLTSNSTDSHPLPLKQRLLDVSYFYLKESAITRNAASELLSTLLVRPDMKQELDQFLHQSMKTIKKFSQSSLNDALQTENQSLVSGLFSVVCSILQKGDRNKLLPYVQPLLQSFFAYDSSNPIDSESPRYDFHSNVIISRKWSAKLAQRLSLVLLQPRNPSWRYQKSTSSIMDNIKLAASKQNSLDAPKSNGKPIIDNQDNEEDDEFELPDMVEDFVQLLLSALKDKDTVVRWSAAKGIGRLTSRLPKALGDEIVGSLISIFDPSETESAWHGVCLAIAELARRGLLLPDRLCDVLSKLTLTLQYEVRRGTHTTGHHVRDAACYVAWAIARAYDPGVLRNHLIVTLASSLLLTALLDKEVNCRRAAAAAFQEHVGRQGNFPHGIQIISMVNFFTLSNRTDCYLTLAPQVAEFPEYTSSIINHLAFSKCHHVDHTIRSLAAQSLAKFCLLDSNFTSVSLPKLIQSSVNQDIAVRQGSIQAISAVLSSISDSCSQETRNDPLKLQEYICSKIPLDVQEKICDIPQNIEQARLYRGRGAEYVRIAVCRLIGAISKVGIDFKLLLSSSKSIAPGSSSSTTSTSKASRTLPAIAQRLAGGNQKVKEQFTAAKNKDYLSFYLETIEENLRHPKEEVINAAIDCIKFLSDRYIFDDSSSSKLIQRWISIVNTDPNPAARRGHSLALGALSNKTIGSSLHLIIDCLVNSTKSKGKKHPLEDVEARRNSIIALESLLTKLNFKLREESSTIAITKNQIEKIYNSLIACLSDYTTDNRGDIGSIVRESSISCLGYLLLKLSSTLSLLKDSWLSASMVQTFMCWLIKMCWEKIDRTRDRAGTMLQLLLESAKAPTDSVNSHTLKYRYAQWQIEASIPSDFIPLGNELLESIDHALVSPSSRSVITNSLMWSCSSVVFPMLIGLLKNDTYRYWVCFGIIRSIGGTNNNQELVNDATKAILSFLGDESNQNSYLPAVVDAFISILKNHIGNPGNEQIVSSLWLTLDFLFSSGTLYKLNEPHVITFANELQKETRAELKHPAGMNKLCACVPLFAHLLGFKHPQLSQMRTSALNMMIFFLTYKYPVIRKSASEALYLQLQTGEHLFPDDSERQAKLERAQEFLGSFPWGQEGDMQQTKSSLNDIFGLTKPAT